MIKNLILSLLVIGTCSFLTAQETEVLYLKDGSILKGVMVEQEPGKSVLFSSDDVQISKGVCLVSTDLYKISWSDISYIEKEDKPDLLLSGTYSEVVLKDGKFHKGFIKEIYPGLEIKLKVENKELVFNYNIIETINTLAINVQQPIVEQFYYVDKIVLKGGKEVEGYIVKQNIGKSLSVISDDVEIEVQNSDVLKLIKTRNEKYRPVYDIVLQPGQFVYNKCDVIFQTIEPTPANIYIIDTECDDVIEVSGGQKVSIYANLINKKTEIQAIKSLSVSEKARLVGNKTNHFETFKIEDFASSNILVEKSEESKVGTTEFSFTPYEVGYYVLKVSSKTGFIVIRVL